MTRESEPATVWQRAFHSAALFLDHGSVSLDVEHARLAATAAEALVEHASTAAAAAAVHQAGGGVGPALVLLGDCEDRTFREAVAAAARGEEWHGLAPESVLAAAIAADCALLEADPAHEPRVAAVSAIGGLFPPQGPTPFSDPGHSRPGF